MLHSKTFKDYLQEYALIVVGSVIYAAGFRFFYYPNDIIAGGVTGIAMIINYLTEIPVGVINIVINIPLFILAWRAFGLKFIVGSFVATMLSSVLMDVFALIPISVTDNLLLAAIYGGVIYGLGLGLIYRAGDTTGGIDIVAKFVRRKYPYINFGTIILILDVIIIAAFALIFNQYEAAMYAIIGMFIVTRVIDLVLYGMGTSKVCYIISDESDKLKNAITATLGRGVTLLHGEGAYTGKAKNVILKAPDHGRAAHNQVHRHPRLPHSDGGEERLRQRLRRYIGGELRKEIDNGHRKTQKEPRGARLHVPLF